MIPRGILDIDWRSLWFATRLCFGRPGPSHEIESAIHNWWDGGNRPGIVCLSVRSGLDALLQAVGWAAGSEILMSAVTIPDMARIVTEHGFVPVPVDVQASSVAPDLDQLQARITPRTRAIIVAHLFGSRLDLVEIARIARDHGLQLWEDVAQGFAGDGFPGDAVADVSLFSFGLIKAQTALGGAYLRIGDEDLAQQCRRVIAQWSQQPVRVFRARILRTAVLKFVSHRLTFTLLTSAAGILCLDIDERLSRGMRGFGGADLFKQLRQRLCDAQVELLRYRLQQQRRDWIARKTRWAEEYRRLLPPHVIVGSDAFFPSHWVLPIRCQDPQRLRLTLAKQGYDATVRGSNLQVIPPPPAYHDWTTPEASGWVPKLLYLPLHPDLRDSDIRSIADTVVRSGQIAASDEIVR